MFSLSENKAIAANLDAHERFMMNFFNSNIVSQRKNCVHEKHADTDESGASKLEVKLLREELRLKICSEKAYAKAIDQNQRLSAKSAEQESTIEQNMQQLSIKSRRVCQLEQEYEQLQEKYQKEVSNGRSLKKLVREFKQTVEELKGRIAASEKDREDAEHFRRLYSEEKIKNIKSQAKSYRGRLESTRQPMLSSSSITDSRSSHENRVRFGNPKVRADASSKLSPAKRKSSARSSRSREKDFAKCSSKTTKKRQKPDRMFVLKLDGEEIQLPSSTFGRHR